MDCKPRRTTDFKAACTTKEQVATPFRGSKEFSPGEEAVFSSSCVCGDACKGEGWTPSRT